MDGSTRTTTTLDTPESLERELTVLKNEIGLKSNEFDAACRDWFDVQPEKEREWAKKYIATDGPDYIRKATARGYVAREEWAEIEGRYIALKRKLESLDKQATICQSLLKTQRSMG